MHPARQQQAEPGGHPTRRYRSNLIGCQADVYPENKYLGNYETVAALAYRGHDLDGLREFARRLAFTILIVNGDAHLKNWSLISLCHRGP